MRLLRITCALAVLPVVLVSVAFVAPQGDTATVPPKKQIAALKRQVKELKREVADLNRRVAELRRLEALIPQLAEIAASTAKYRNVDQALADGFAVDPAGCIRGAGIHYGRSSGGDDDVLDPSAPETLVYGRTGAGLKLVAVEYVVPQRFARPTLFGTPFSLHSGGASPIWFLHVWLWHPSPGGLFALINQEVPC